LVPALLVERWFGPAFNLARLRHVLGLLAAAAFGSAAGSVCWIVASRLFYGPTGPILTTFQYWFLSDMIGFITLGPFVLGLFAAWRQPPPQREIMEGLANIARPNEGGAFQVEANYGQSGAHCGTNWPG
jgi:integral membrane sensor domain MASE1